MFIVPQTPLSATNAAESCHVKVYARTRPLLKQELAQNARNIVRVLTPEKQIILDDSNNDKHFKFEDVFCEDSTQEYVYKTAVAPLVAKVGDGHKATVLAYGQTGSGKTYSMGTDPCRAKDDEGILQRAMFDLLTEKEGSLKLSFVEVYNEVLYDLLATTRKPLSTKTGMGGAVSPVGMIEEDVTTVEEGLKLLERGGHHRSVATTALNQHSSRSHAMIYITTQNGVKDGCLILVDLAGAEGVGRAQTKGQTFLEGININKGLLTLGKVLSALSNPVQGYVPYRESILTRLLKDSLGGSSHTAMIACVNPASYNLHETINTLRYAEQAQNIRMKPQVFSTIKSGIKRRCEDVTATPGAWKRRATSSIKKKDHNTTVSTPGHKPANRPQQVFNNTFNTPSIKLNGDTLDSSIVSSSKFLQPCASSKMPQPIFEDDSPIGFSTTSILGNTKMQAPSFSPFLERMTNRLEHSIMSQFESIEDRVADRIITKLKAGKRRKSSRKNKTLNSTPIDERKSLSIIPSDEIKTPIGEKSSSCSSDDDSLTMALLGGNAGKKVLKKLIKGVMREVNAPTKNIKEKAEENDPSKLKVRNPLGEISNTGKRISLKENEACSIMTNTALNFENPFMAVERPLTSTTFNDKRHVRKSTRLSTKRSIHNALFKELSPLVQEATRVFSPQMFSDTKSENTILCKDGASPVLQPRVFPTKSEPSEIVESKMFETVLGLPSNDLTLGNQDKTVIHVDRTRESFSTSLLQIDRIRKDKPIEKTVRRSTRVSAIMATQKNFKILTGSSPATSLCKPKKSFSRTSSTRGPSHNVTVQVKSKEDKVSPKDDRSVWKLVMSPRQQDAYNKEILDILNNGTVRKLQQLPTIGPKTAIILYNHRSMFGKFSLVDEIAKVPALSRSFYTRFMKANLMNRISLDI